MDQRWLPAVEQYMSLIGSLTISPDLEGQFERYFSHFNTVVKHMFEFYADTHQYHIQFIKQGLTALDASLSSDLSLQRLCLRAYRSTSGISSTLMGIRSQVHLDMVLEELDKKELKAQLDWNKLDRSRLFPV